MLWFNTMISLQLTWRLCLRNKSTAMGQRIGHCLGIGFLMRLIGLLLFGRVVLLPRESGAKKREGFPCTSRWLKQCMAMAVFLSSIEGRNDPSHESELRSIRLIRKFHFDSTDVIYIFSFRVWFIAFGSCRDHYRAIRWRFLETRKEDNEQKKSWRRREIRNVIKWILWFWREILSLRGLLFFTACWSLFGQEKAGEGGRYMDRREGKVGEEKVIFKLIKFSD